MDLDGHVDSLVCGKLWSVCLSRSCDCVFHLPLLWNLGRWKFPSLQRCLFCYRFFWCYKFHYNIAVLSSLRYLLGENQGENTGLCRLYYYFHLVFLIISDLDIGCILSVVWKGMVSVRYSSVDLNIGLMLYSLYPLSVSLVKKLSMICLKSSQWLFWSQYLRMVL